MINQDRVDIDKEKQQVDIDKEKQKLVEMANDEKYSDEQREEVRARLQRFQDEQKL